jgi:NAD(P)-dependent dehydrogenase (short-subunit alcohol dehydrogenase family)
MNPASSDFLQQYGPWAVVTGASEGIGRAFAVELTRRGMHVLLVVRRQERLEQLAAELTQVHGVQCQVLPASLSHPEGVQQLLEGRTDRDVGRQAEDPQVVARASLDALSGMGTVRPGLLAKVLGYSLALTPRWGRVKIMGKVMADMTRHAQR